MYRSWMVAPIIAPERQSPIRIPVMVPLTSGAPLTIHTRYSDTTMPLNHAQKATKID